MIGIGAPGWTTLQRGGGEEQTNGVVTAAPLIEFRGVGKRFGDVVAASGLNLKVGAGEFLSFLGPSGCGKTTALRMIAGFEQPSEGDVLIGGDNMNGVPAYRRPVNMVFQHYALFPHLDVAGNVAYGLRQRSPRPSRAELEGEVAEALEMMRLPGYERRRIWELSGGQQQRVALARALINEPKVLLLDEPLAALDRKLRREMQIELQNLQRLIGITFILVTHDQEEALSMSDRVAIMREGHIVQIGAPRELYDEPASRYVADFVGKSNFFEGVARSVAEGIAEIDLDAKVATSARTSRTANPIAAGEKVSLSVRPEQMSLSRTPDRLPAASAYKGSARVLNRIFLGEHTEYLVEEERLGRFLALSPRQSELGDKPFEVGDSIYVAWRREAAIALPLD
jgi:spermidine/putrescine transport system ATP-binding protein